MGRVLISAGHTVMDPGQIFGDLREADLTRKIAPKIIPYIQKAGVEVQGVPLDLPLLQRVEWINNTGYSDAQNDVLIEIHINDGNKRGIEAWFRGEGGNNSQKLAKVVVDTVCEITNYQKQGIHAEHEHELRSLTFLNRTNPAAVLLETLFIDNPEDIAILKDDAKLEELAKAIATGILKYLGKDIDGKDLPEDQKPKFDDLKPVPRPVEPDLDEDDLDDFAGMFSSAPKLPAFANTSPTTPRVAPTPPPAIPGFPSAGMGGLGGIAGLGAGMGRPGMPTMPGLGGNMQDREQRREMIKTLYLKMLGREPTPSDLNYFINQGINETDLTKKIVESQEHLDLVKSKQKLADAEKELEELKSENQKLRSQQKDQEAITANLQNLLQHQKRSIAQLEAVVADKHGMPSSTLLLSQQNQSQSPKGTSSDKAGVAAKRSLPERIFYKLSQMLAK